MQKSPQRRTIINAFIFPFIVHNTLTSPLSVLYHSHSTCTKAVFLLSFSAQTAFTFTLNKTIRGAKEVQNDLECKFISTLIKDKRS
ncbi:MAG: hypothetical protein ACTTHI_00215 [Prevotella sp.]